MEALRLLAMCFVLALHANFYSLGVPTAAQLEGNTLPAVLRLFLEEGALVAVNVFVLISGWFGIRPSWRGVSKLLTQVLFAAAVTFLIYVAYHGEMPAKEPLLQAFCLGGGWWFVPAYLLLYLLAKPLNTFIDSCAPQQLLHFVLLYLGLQLVYGTFYDFANYDCGYSTLSFIGLYLLARYVRLHATRWKHYAARHFAAAYFIITLLLTGLYYANIRYHLPWEPLCLNYNSPLVILSSLSLLLCFVQLRFTSRAVNWLAGSSFAIYLIHISPFLRGDLKQLFRYLWQHTDGIICLLTFTLTLVGIGLACILIDKLRPLLPIKLSVIVKPEDRAEQAESAPQKEEIPHDKPHDKPHDAEAH